MVTFRGLVARAALWVGLTAPLGARADAVEAAAVAGASSAARDGVTVVEVVDDPFVRWRGTRWSLQTQIGFPWPVVLLAEQTQELQVVALDVRLVTHCDVVASLAPKVKEVVCAMEAASVIAAPWRDVADAYADVASETARSLARAKVLLQVHANGRVLNVGLLDEAQTNRRVNVRNENLRQIVSRAFAGFDLQRPDAMTPGAVWAERQSRLFDLPSFRYVALSGLMGASLEASLDDRTAAANPGAGALPRSPGAIDVPSAPGRALTTGTAQAPIARLQAPTSAGHSTLVHEMREDVGGRWVVGEGSGYADLGAEMPLGYAGTCDDLAVFDRGLGYLTERRWVVDLAPTAGNPLADGVAGWTAWQIGSLAWIGGGAQPTLPASGLAAWPGAGRDVSASTRRPWPTLDAPR
jgi:hypothetical protein